MMLQLGEIESAREVLQRALELARRLDDPFLQARALNSLGIAWRESGDPHRARDLLERSVVVARSINSVPRESTALTNLAVTLLDLGERTEAVRVGRTAVAASESLGDVWGTSIDRVNLAVALLRAEGARSAFEQVCGAADEALACADVELSIWVVEVFVMVLAEFGHGAAAARLLGCADQHRKRTGITRSGPDRALLDVSLRRVEGEVGWAHAYDQGRSLGFEEAVQEACSVPAAGR
jgi:tetratricopeptide (TPR) repeat protein